MALLQMIRRNDKEETPSTSLYNLPEEYLKLEYPEEWKSLEKMNIKDKAFFIVY